MTIEEQSEALDIDLNTSEPLVPEHFEFLENSGLVGIEINDKSLEIIDSDLSDDIKINLLKNLNLRDKYDQIKNLDEDTIKAIIAQGDTDLTNLGIDDEDSSFLANEKIAEYNEGVLDNKQIEEIDELEEEQEENNEKENKK